jgi:hypothetical protein
MQEDACDCAIHRLGIAPTSLAQAAVIVARHTQSIPATSFLSTFSHQCDLNKRVEKILCPPAPHRLRGTVQLVFLIIGLLSIVGGRLWIF